MTGGDSTGRLLLLAVVLFHAVKLSAGVPAGNALQDETPLRPSFSRFEQRQEALNHALQSTSAFAQATNWTMLEDNSGVKKKSRGRAFLQSLILPGWGQHYAESKNMMRAFVASEALLWASYIGLTTWSNWLEDDFRTFSATHAGVQTTDKPKRYFVDIGNFDNIFDFNQAQLRGRDVTNLYPETEEFFWQWDSEEHRREFEDTRVRSDRADDRSKLVLAGIFVNHLASAIHSTLAVFRFNKRLEENKIGMRIYFDSAADDRRISLNLSKGF